jgi:hypothetical protein
LKFVFFGGEEPNWGFQLGVELEPRQFFFFFWFVFGTKIKGSSSNERTAQHGRKKPRNSPE